MNTAAQEVVDPTFRDAVIEMDSVTVASQDSLAAEKPQPTLIKGEKEKQKPTLEIEKTWNHIRPNIKGTWNAVHGIQDGAEKILSP